MIKWPAIFNVKKRREQTMSGLWHVEVKEKDENWVDIKVRQIHPDAGNFPEDPNFDFQLLTQKAYKYNDNFEKIPARPLGEKIPFDYSYLPENIEEYVNMLVMWLKRS
jgi:hypothetical protein